MYVPSEDTPLLGVDPTLPLKDKIIAAIQSSTGALSPVDAFFSAWNNPVLVDDYKSFVSGLEEALKINLHRENIQATISSRVKSNSSIEKSIQRRETAQGHCYNSPDEIFQGIHDLAGLRIVVDFPPGIQAAKKLVERLKVVSKTEFTSDRDLGLEWKPRFGSFESTNYCVKINPAPDNILYMYQDVLIEIQILSLAESLYNKLVHPLIYKKTPGQKLSVKDQKLIDVAHGLSLCYWICFSSMQDQLEGQEMPEPVRRIGAAREDAEIEQNMSDLVQATPRLPTSDMTISNTLLLDFIHDSQTQQIKSCDELFDKLVQAVTHAAPTTINNFGSGHTSNDFGNISNSSGFGHVNHAPATYNTYYTANTTSDSTYVKALFITDPRVDKDEIEDEKGGLLNESSDWILQHDDFKTWDRGNSSGILWINGEPGKGKTMLMCRIVDELSLKVKLSYFFCKAHEPNTNNATSVLQGLMYLLIRQDDVAMGCFERECRKYGPQYFENKSFKLSQLRTILRSILAALSDRYVYLAIDALDECVEGQGTLLQIIKDSSQSHHVRWVVSSRNKPFIAEHLERASTSISLERNEISVSAAVTKYIKHKTTALFDQKRYEEKMKKDVIEILSSKAQSTFLWVSLACKMLAYRESFDPVGVLDDFPSGLDFLYDMMLNEIQSSSSSKLYRQIMNVVLTVLRPVSVHELQSLTPLFPKGLRDDKIIEVILYCGCFLSVRESFVHFVHQSAKDFLLNPDSGFCYDAEQQHYELLMTSLTVMSTLHSTTKYEPMRYSCTQWAFHISQCKSEKQAHELRDGSHVDKFLHETYLEWFKALGYLNAVSNGILCLLELIRNVSGRTSAFAKLIEEEVAFMRRHRSGIETSPHTIYGSLVFSPTSSMMRKVYGKQEPKWITLKPAVDDLSTPIHSLEGHISLIKDIKFSYDGRLLASASEDGTIRIWDVATGESIHVLRGNNYWVYSVSFSGSNYRLASASADTVIIWDAETGEHINSIHNQTTSSDVIFRPSVALSKGGEWVCSSALEGFKLWNSETGSLIRTFRYEFEPKSENAANSVAISRCGNLLTGAHNEVVLLWNLESGELLYTFVLQELRISNPLLKFSTEDKLWVVGDEHFFLLDPGTKDILRKGKRNEMALHLADASRHRGNAPLASDDSVFDESLLDWVQHYDREPGFNLLGTSSDYTIEIWDLAITSSTSSRMQQSRYPHRVSFFPNGNFIISTPYELPVAIWHFDMKKLTQTFDFQSTLAVQSPVIAMSGNIIAYIENGRLSVRNVSTGVRYYQLEDEIGKRNPGNVILGTISNDEKWIALGSAEHLHVYDIENRRHCRHVKGPGGVKNREAVFSHSSRQLAVSSTGFIKIFNTNSWIERVLVIPKGSQADELDTVSLLFSVDESSLMYSCYWKLSSGETKINIWKLVGEHELRTLKLGFSCKLQSFDSQMSLITTNVGNFELREDTVHSRGYALSRDTQWVLWCDKPVLWLPPEFRPWQKFECCEEVYDGHKIVIGLTSGLVLFLGFDPDGPAADLKQVSHWQKPLTLATRR
ncbi:hypothetical protein FPOA_03526 [Fusarium poae]|uniref:RelA/SpoT domain-containing protein n=1 Tax=Fusarium poae TaxID=36050 RepID=A0A1B8BA29_FUSPO|nr:hypothetical protein FPOA_03526 [Fusarium poae]